jgi:hypothetical protein
MTEIRNDIKMRRLKGSDIIDEFIIILRYFGWDGGRTEMLAWVGCVQPIDPVELRSADAGRRV